MPENFPAILFATVSILSAALALGEWNARSHLARFATAAAALAALCFAANHAWSRYSIRVDLLLTIPSVSLAALVVGVLAMGRPPASSGARPSAARRTLRNDSGRWTATTILAWAILS